MRKHLKVVFVFALVLLMGFSTLAYARANPCVCGGSYTSQQYLDTVYKETGNTRECDDCGSTALQLRAYRRILFTCPSCQRSYTQDVPTDTYLWACNCN